MSICSTNDQAGTLCPTDIMLLNPACQFKAAPGFPLLIQHNTQGALARLEELALHLIFWPLLNDYMFHSGRSF